MALVIQKKKLIFLLLSMGTVFVGCISYYFLPERFLYDAMTIVTDRYNEIGLVGSYPFSMWFYKYTGLGALPFPLVALIQLPILLFVIYRLGVPDRFYFLNLKNLTVYISLAILAIFVSMPSKEFINFLVMAIIPFMLSRKRYSRTTVVLLSMMILVGFGLWFRLYYVLIPVLSLAMFMVAKIKIPNKTFAVMVLGLFVVFCLSLSYGVVKGQFLSQSTREHLNDEREGSEDANSMITSPFPADTWYGEGFGITYGFFSVNLPVNGLKFLLKPQIIAFVLWQLVLFILLLACFDACLKKKRYYSYEVWGFYFLFSYFIVQGVFEPDLGSAMRHKMGMFPLIYFALYYDYFRNREK